MTEKDIIKILDDFYFKQVRFCINNAYIFKHNWESDFFILRKNGFCNEYEIKISKQDFKNDFKKDIKHQILKSGSFLYKYRKFSHWEDGINAIYNNVEEIRKWNLRPNKFFYVVPENLIKLEDIPEYAGLVYCKQNGDLIVVKEAPFLHKENLTDKLINILCDKFYWRSRKINGII